MMKSLAITLILASTCVSLASAEPEGGTLAGGYGFFSDTCRENSKAKDCVMTLQIDGEGAKALYDRMPDKSVADECTGGVVKEDQNGMRCYKEGAEYSCDFGYSFVERKLVASDVTC